MQDTATVTDNIDLCEPQVGGGGAASSSSPSGSTTTDQSAATRPSTTRAHQLPGGGGGGGGGGEPPTASQQPAAAAAHAEQVVAPERRQQLVPAIDCRGTRSIYDAAPNEEQEQEQDGAKPATDCCNTRPAGCRRRWSLASLWSSNNPGHVTGGAGAGRANLGSTIACCLVHSRQANQFSSAACLALELHSRRRLPCVAQRHKHSTPANTKGHQLNNKPRGHGREHITSANNTTTQSPADAYRRCASGARDDDHDAARERRRPHQGGEEAAAAAAAEAAATSGCGGEQHNYDTSPVHNQAYQGDHRSEDAKQQPPPPLPEASQSRHNSTSQQQTRAADSIHNNITCPIQEALGILASPLRLASGSSSSSSPRQAPTARQPAAPPVSSGYHSGPASYATCATTTCLAEEPLRAPQCQRPGSLLSKPAQWPAQQAQQLGGTSAPSESRRPVDAMEPAPFRERWNRRGSEEQQVVVEPPPATDAARIANYITSSTHPPPRSTYPNNTLIADLSKCHRNVAQAWPKQSWLGACLKGCWRAATGAPAKFRRLRFQMPDAVVRSNVSITHDDYDRALCALTSDVRYQLHLLLYRRVQAIWMLFTTLLCTSAALVLVSNLETVVTVGAICAWLALQLVGAIVTSRFRRKLDEMLEKSVAQVNSFFMEHNLMLGVINSGSCIISKSKFLIPVLYFNTKPCREYIESIISVDLRKITSNNSNHHRSDQENDDAFKNYCQPKSEAVQTAGCNGIRPSASNDTANHTSETTTDKHILDYSKIGLPLTKPNQMGLAQSQLAKKIILRYSQRWISLFDKRKLMFNDDQVRPRHLSTGKCLCQFIEEHFCHDNINHPPKRTKSDNCKPPPCHGLVRVKQVANNNQVSISIPTDTVERVPTGKRHVSPLKSYMLAKPTAKISTLSRLVSLKDRKQHRQDDLEHVPTTKNSTCHGICLQANHLQPLSWRDPSKGYPNGSLYTPYVTMDPLDQSINGTTNLSQASGISRTPTSSPDVSLEMDTESISRSDELVKKLRLLLELKKDEIQSLEGPLFSPVYCRESPRSTLTNGSRADGNSDRSLMNSNILNYQDSHETNTGKKMYLQRYGLFFLGTSGAKKNHHHEETGRNQGLRMC